LPSDVAPPTAAAFELLPAEDQEPIRVSTVLGDLEFTVLQVPLGHGFFALEATPYGPVTEEGSRTVYWSTDGVTWEGIVPTVGPWRLTIDGDDVIVHGEGYARLVWDGSTWIETATVALPSPTGDLDPGLVSQIAFGPRATVALIDGELYSSTDGVSFVKAATGLDPELLTGDAAHCAPSGPGGYGEPPLTQIGPVFATDDGFVLLTPAHPTHWNQLPACEPVLWFSEDGSTWHLHSRQSPFGDGAIVHNIAEHDGRYVAVGAAWADHEDDTVEGAVWTSGDGLRWQRAPVELVEARGIGGGELGWILTGTAEWTDSVDIPVDMWFSTDGIGWDGPYRGPEALWMVYWLPDLAVGTDVIYGIGGVFSETLVIGRLVETEPSSE
jgi:hypothetical protein